jgi:hypothetical protein
MQSAPTCLARRHLLRPQDLEEKIMDLLSELQAEGLIPDDVSKRDLRHCFYGRWV